jgi:hypothetical protein
MKNATTFTVGRAEIAREERRDVTIVAPALPWDDLRAWQRFMLATTGKQGFVLGAQDKRFVASLCEYAATHKTMTLGADTPLYRARRYKPDQRRPFDLAEMGAPPTDCATPGRANAKGAPCLYLASDSRTAISEVRPWRGCELTIADFRLVRDMRLVNCSAFLDRLGKGSEGAELTWRQFITWMFSAPLHPEDGTAYAPTQHLTQQIKESGADGTAPSTMAATTSPSSRRHLPGLSGAMPPR